MEYSKDNPKRKVTPLEALHKIDEIRQRKEDLYYKKLAEEVKREASKITELGDWGKPLHKPRKEVYKLPANRKGIIRRTNKESMKIIKTQRKKMKKRTIAKAQT